LTGKGTILGTLEYMAPEQLEGKETDARTDIFAFGGVLYEMATGHKAFDGKSAPSVMAAILERDPAPISTLQPLTPYGFEHVVKTCLAKDPDARWQGAADLARELRWIADSDRHTPGPTPVGHSRGKWAWIAATAIASLLAGVFALAYFTRKTPDAAAVRFSFAPPFKANALDVAVSHDGRRIAFADAGRGSDLWLRSVESLTAEKLPGTEGAWRPLWSPDGRSLGFFNGGLRTVDVGSRQSPVQAVASVNSEFGFAWSPEGIFLYTPEGTGTGLYRVAASGGAAAPATRLNSARHEITHRYPQFLPDGRHFIYWVWSASEENTGIYAGSLDPKEKLPEGPLVRTWREARYAEPGYLLFLQESTLVAQRFDTTRLRLTGEPRSLPELVGLDWGYTGRAMFSVSRGGVLAYQEAEPLPGARIVWRDRAGRQLRSTEAPQGTKSRLSLAPDEKHVVVTNHDENTLEDLWVVDLERATSMRLTATHASSVDGVWAPAGRRVAFRSNRGGVYDLYAKDTGGVGEEELLVTSPHFKIPTGWSPDGRFLIYLEVDPKTGTDIWVLPLEGDRKPFPFLKTEFNESEGRLSPVPDSQGHLWMAYASDETGQLEIYLRQFLPGAPGGPAGVRVRVSNKGGDYPEWRKDGRELFYIRDNKLMAVDVKLGASVEVGTQKALFDFPAGAEMVYIPFADGRRFLLTEPVGEPPAPKINVVLNWTAELKR
jgi:Tol biopolymer transport system component